MPSDNPNKGAVPGIINPKTIAEAFVQARLSASALTNFPGAELPPNLDAAYQCQDLAIDLWQDKVVGWKVGQIPVDLREALQVDRLAGPIFGNSVVKANSQTPSMPIFDKGFAAVEAEFIAVTRFDAPKSKTTWSLDETREIILAVHTGIEIASSPLKTINQLGPLVVVSDFGNNYGLIVGDPIPDWSNRELDTLTATTQIDEEKVGAGGAFNLSGGILRSVQFMLENAAARNRPLPAGCFIATGQTTGIHDIQTGQTANISFGNDGDLSCIAVSAKPGI